MKFISRGKIQKKNGFIETMSKKKREKKGKRFVPLCGCFSPIRSNSARKYLITHKVVGKSSFILKNSLRKCEERFRTEMFTCVCVAEKTKKGKKHPEKPNIA